MILIISGVVVVVGLLLLVIGWTRRDLPDLLGSGIVVTFLGVFVGFFLGGFICPVRTVKTIIPSTIAVTADAVAFIYGDEPGDVVATHDIRIVKNPARYAVQKIVDYNSYGGTVKTRPDYAIAEKNGN